MANITFTREVITPTLAAEYLKSNTANRPLNQTTVAMYARDMERDKWREFPGDPLTFAENGTLIDGQHRLSAIISANCPVAMYVVRGADASDFLVTNTGRQRRAGDVLAIKGCPKYHAVAAAISVYFALVREYTLLSSGGASKRLLRVTNEDIAAEYDSSADLYNTVANMAQRIYKPYRLLHAGMVGGIITYLIKQKFHAIGDVEAFFTELNDPAPEYPYLRYLRRRLSDSLYTAARGKEKLTPQMKMVLVSKAWNIYITGDHERKVVNCTAADRPRFE